ncbi:hypothetical protein [Deinococcus sp. UYEF24]
MLKRIFKSRRGMAELQLYRFRIFESELFPIKRSRRDMILSAIREKPSLGPSSNNRLKVSKWHIGNVEVLDDDSYAFALGRQSPTNTSKYNDDTGDFYSSLDEDAPYSIVIFDANIGLVAILVRPNVAQVKTMADRLLQLFYSTDTFKNSGVRLAIDPIYDSDLFLNLIRQAYQIKRFIFDFYPPNPDDPEMEIQAPVEQWAQNTNASHGRISVDGNNLNERALEPVARGVISSGSEVVAVIRENANSKRTRRISSKTQKVSTEVEKVSIDVLPTLQ